MLLGDFNQVLTCGDKLKFLSTLYGANLFEEAIFESEVFELKNNRVYYTWINNKNGNSDLWEKLDKCLVNELWLNCFLYSYLCSLLIFAFDHSPLIVNID